MQTVWRLSLVLCIVAAFAAFTWFAGNGHDLLDAGSPRQAVRLVVTSYGEKVDWQRAELEPIARRDVPLHGRDTTYAVVEDGRVAAHVTLRNFLGLGWQEIAFIADPRND